jgi:putative hydrolase of the HAD superfamily
MQVKSIFFDLDHTLWDFELNSSLTLKELCQEFNLNNIFKAFDENIFIKRFNDANQLLWQELNRNHISIEQLRINRILYAIEPFGKLNKDLYTLINEKYLEKCPQKSNLMPHVNETLEILKKKGLKLYVLTNGFEEIQLAKLVSSNIFHFFDDLITFNKTGVRKPHIDFFKYALKICKDEPTSCVMVGDNPSIDLIGADYLKIKTIWFNPNKESLDTYTINHSFKPCYEIYCFKELIHIVSSLT